MLFKLQLYAIGQILLFYFYDSFRYLPSILRYSVCRWYSCGSGEFLWVRGFLILFIQNVLRFTTFAEMQLTMPLVLD